MKKLILLLTTLFLMLTSFGMVASAVEVDEEFQANFDPYEYFTGIIESEYYKNLYIANIASFGEFIGEVDGYVLYHYTRDGADETYLLDRSAHVPNVLVVSLDRIILDEVICAEGETVDFYGIQVKKIIPMFDKDDPNRADESVNPFYRYEIETAEYYTWEQSTVLFEGQSDVFRSGLKDTDLGIDPDFDLIEPIDVVTGDVNGNGEIDSRDYVLLKRAYFGTYKLPDVSKIPADVNYNGEIDSRDYVLLKRAYFGTYKIGTVDDGLAG